VARSRGGVGRSLGEEVEDRDHEADVGRRRRGRATDRVGKGP
jgi:hypothetical protein